LTNLDRFPHRRYNPLLDEWVLVSPHRTQRPWQGQEESSDRASRPAHDPQCYLCSGNTRANGEVNPLYADTFVFANDFAALKQESGVMEPSGHPLFQVAPVRGECRVMCFSPRHDLTLAEMQPADVSKVVSAWRSQYAELSAHYEWVQVFENKGAVMGCSNPHPHGQIWASDAVPTLAQKEEFSQAAYFEKSGVPLLQSVAEEEVKVGERVVELTEHWVAVVPFWAVWPFEILLMPRHSVPSFNELSFEAESDLANILSRILVRYDNLFETSFPYSMGWHNAPSNSAQPKALTLHAHFYPPLLRSASVKKFMVGYEMLAEPQRDITPEQAASMLRNVSPVHYKAQ
jgi:UDPglucose--hexose-1-phosphate uridylyltransferase